MKTIILVTAFAALALPAWAGLPLGRGELTANVTATVTHDSNVFGTPDATADWSGLLAPRVTYLRKAGRIEADLNAGISFIRYAELTELDAENLDASATLSVAAEKNRSYSGLLSAVYRESSEINSDLNQRLNTQATILSTRSTLITGPRTEAVFGANYTDTRRSAGSDQQILAGEAHYDYRDFFYGNFLRVTGTYDEIRSSGEGYLGMPLHRDSSLVSAGLGRNFYHDNFRGLVSYGHRILNRSAAESPPGEERQAGGVFSATLEGPFLPKRYFPRVTSLINLSYLDSSTPGIYDTGTRELTGNLSLSWQAREATTLTFSAHRAQRLAANDYTVLTNSVRFGLEQALRFNLTGTLGASLDWSSYRGIAREDRTTNLHAGLRYTFARVWTANLTGNFTATSSSVSASDYDRLVTSLSVTREF